MPTEVELKLRLPSSQARCLQSSPVLCEITPQKYRLLNTYYDTPEFDLRKRNIAVRIRRKGRSVWLMTVKGCDSGAGGLAQRSEWEAPTQPGVFDFEIVTDENLREFLKLHHPQLQPIFSTDFTRTAWTLGRSDALIELALDRGKISVLNTGDTKTSACELLCEIELELLEGKSPDVLFELAAELGSGLPELHLHPEIRSKAERGYMLVDSALAGPVKAATSTVELSMTPVAAFRSIALSCLSQLQRNETGAICGKNPEYVHQARVAIRRLRSALKLFSPILAGDFVDSYARRWQELASGLGSARDWDVFLTETLTPLEEAFPDDPDLAVLRTKGGENQARNQATAGKTLTQKTYSQLLLTFSAAVLRVDSPNIGTCEKLSAANNPSTTSLRKFARRRLQKHAEIIEAQLKEHGKMSAERRHQLRIAFKKLRYTLDFFTPILPRKRLPAYQSSLSAIQDLLGTLNDQTTASRLIKEIHPKGKPDSLTRGWIAGRTQLLIKALGAELNKFATCKRPWR